MTNLTYPNERFSKSVSYLISRFPIKERIKKGYSEIWEFKPEELPEESRNKILDLHERMTKIKKNNGYYVDDTIAEMDDLEAQGIAETILSIYIDIKLNLKQ